MKLSSVRHCSGFSVSKDDVTIRFEQPVSLVHANVRDFVRISKRNFEIDFSLERDSDNAQLLSDVTVEVRNMHKTGKSAEQMVN